MPYSRKFSDSHRKNISNALRGRVLDSNHRSNISKSIKARWDQIKVPIDPEKTNMTLDCEIDENNNLKKVMFNGTEIPM